MTERDFCEECDEPVWIEDIHIETDEPRSLREYRVIDLSCGHSIQQQVQPRQSSLP